MTVPNHVVDLEASIVRSLRFWVSGQRCLDKRCRSGESEQWALAGHTLVPRFRKRPIGEFSLSRD
ncbi:hypothetical protein RISK_001835 [Rhodopirellula islandica]|uniref:Uncharacterized protein n=1 Tax=Rhodopirellula islandica TaxID=595434 RepID=A0A0J1EKD1_RHOIS|nr:hypothetical protein RISK_001835 [Rhodopirellula islandica]